MSMNPFVRRFVLFFAIMFVPTAALDVWTTELGRRRPNTVELNPICFMPLQQSILGEIPLLLIGAGLVALLGMLGRYSARMGIVSSGCVGLVHDAKGV